MILKEYKLIKIFIMILAIFILGTLGYYIIEENWTLFDGFYMTAISITTVGFGETIPLSNAGRIFTIFLIFIGLGSAAVFATQLAQKFIDNNYQRYLGERKMLKKISKLRNHYIICGYGDIGSSICKSLDDSEIPFVIIEESEDNIKWARQRNYLLINGKSTYDSTLIQAGIKDASGIIISMGDDSLNMYVALASRELNSDIYIITRGYKTEIEKRLIRAGADRVVYPLKMGGEQIASLIKNKIGNTEESRIISENSQNVLGYSLKVYKNYRDKDVSIDNICGEFNAESAIAIINKDGKRISISSSNMIIQKHESVILVIDNVKSKLVTNSMLESTRFIWSDIFISGIRDIDAEHQKLFEISDEFVKGVKSGIDKEYIARIFDRLIEYTIGHFENEEKLFDKYNYPQKDLHIIEHRKLTEKVLELNHNRSYIFSESVEEFLYNWLKHHILEEDMLFAEYVNNM